MMKKTFLFILFILGVNLSATEIKICTDKATWKPYSYLVNGVPTGVHVEIFKNICHTLKYKCSFIPLPWKRCLSELKEGTFDATVPAAFNEEREVYLHYPYNSFNEGHSGRYLSKVSYHIISMKEEDYIFEGDLNSLPNPVRTMLGYHVTSSLKRHNIKVKNFNSVEDMINHLFKTRKGSVVTVKDNLKAISLTANEIDSLNVSKVPLQTKYYYIPFSKRSNLDKSVRKKIWDELIKLRKREYIIRDLIQKHNQ